MKLIMTRGLPASGKTTWAKEQVLNGNGRVKRINKDDLRAMVDAGQWSKSNEKFILKLRDNFVFEALMAGYDVIVDDTNLAPKHEEQLRAIFKTVESGSWFPGGESNMKFEIKDFTDVSLRTCIDRDSARPNSVGEKTIKRMHRQFLRLEPRTFTAPEYNPDLPNCIIVDIDGTLAHMNGRNPYDYNLVGTDVVDENVANIVRRYAQRDIMEMTPDTYIIIVSGRDDTCKDETLKWLTDNNIPFDEFYMRDHTLVDEKGNKLDDTVIKKDIYEQWIKPRFNVRFVLDDRDRVVKMWREQGLKVLQVAEGDF